MVEFIYEGETKKISQAIVLRYPMLGKGRVRMLIKNKEVVVDGKRIKEDELVQKGSSVRIYTDLPKTTFDIPIIYEDDNLFVFNKPKGIETQGEYSVEGYAKSLCSSACAVHRLDLNTDGVIIVAKHKKAEELLVSAIKENKISKSYLAVVYGQTEKQKELRAYLQKDAKNSKVRIYDTKVEKSVHIITKYRTVYYGDGYSVVDIDLVTGRTHQIRAQFAYIGHQVLGDGKYGRGDINALFPYKKQALTAYKLRFNTDGELDYLNGKIIEIDCSIKSLIK